MSPLDVRFRQLFLDIESLLHDVLELDIKLDSKNRLIAEDFDQLVLVVDRMIKKIYKRW